MDTKREHRARHRWIVGCDNEVMTKQKTDD